MMLLSSKEWEVKNHHQIEYCMSSSTGEPGAHGPSDFPDAEKGTKAEIDKLLLVSPLHIYGPSTSSDYEE